MVFHRLLCFPLLGAAFEGFAFVVEFLSFGERNGDFGIVAFVEVEFEGDDGEAVFVDFGIEFFDLFFVQEEFAWSAFFAGEVGVGSIEPSDMGVHEVEFAFDEAAEGVAEVGAFGTEPFDLGALQHDPGLEGLEDLIVVAGFFVLGDELDGHGETFFW